MWYNGYSKGKGNKTMKKIDISAYEIHHCENRGINKEWSLCNYFGVARKAHDKTPYNKGSDIELDTMNISVKSPKATLMSGNYCKQCNGNFDAILALYINTTHSDTIAFITHEYLAYFMNLAEFETFTRKFGYIKRDSESNGGNYKIAFREETKKMREWLEANAVAA